MKTFQYSDGRSRKFWNVELRGNSLTVTYGRIGGKGQSQTKTFPTEGRARREHDRLVREKLAQGYRETMPAAATPPDHPQPLRDAMGEALAADPDEPRTRPTPTT